MSCDVSFGDNCRYDIGSDQSDINKLFGFSLGMHHENSLRVGWRYVPQKDLIEIVTYIYQNGVRLREKHLDWLNFGQKGEYTIELTDDYYAVFSVGKSVIVKDKIETKKKLYLSYPLSLYFGGNCTAPHDMNIDLKV